jgi:hypothetical protein
MFDWRDYLELANALGGVQGSSISVHVSDSTDRCAVSRAYYAAFCHARNHAEARLGFMPTGRGNDHWLLRQHLSAVGMNDVARPLRRLHGWRKPCDYEDTVANLAVKVRDALREATAVVSRL